MNNTVLAAERASHLNAKVRRWQRSHDDDLFTEIFNGWTPWRSKLPILWARDLPFEDAVEIIDLAWLEAVRCWRPNRGKNFLNFYCTVARRRLSNLRVSVAHRKAKLTVPLDDDLFEPTYARSSAPHRRSTKKYSLTDTAYDAIDDMPFDRMMRSEELEELRRRLKALLPDCKPNWQKVIREILRLRNQAEHNLPCPERQGYQAKDGRIAQGLIAAKTGLGAKQVDNALTNIRRLARCQARSQAQGQTSTHSP